MPQLKKVQHISGNILPKFNISIQEIFGSYQKDDVLVTSPYLPVYIDGDGSQILTSEAESDGGEVTQNRPRKRQRLDHLSQEEKIMRRKMKNRVAAQTARDRKKARMVELEELVTQLEKEKKILALANTELQKQNLALEKENSELKLRLGGKVADESIVKVEKEEVNEEVESRVSVDSMSLEHAEGTGPTEAYTLDDALSLLTCNSESDDILALLQQCSEDLMQYDINSTIPINTEVRKPSTTSEMVGTSSESLESHKELIHFDHIYYKQEEVVSSNTVANTSLTESALSTKDNIAELPKIESEGEIEVSDSSNIPTIDVTTTEDLNCPTDILHFDNTFSFDTFNNGILCSSIKDCPSPASSSDTGYDSSFSIPSPCNAGNSWDETLTELFPTLV